MRIEINNVYQKKSISKVKVVIAVICIFVILCLFIWRLYYEQYKTHEVSSFAEFLGISSFLSKESEVGQVNLKNENIVVNIENTNNSQTEILPTNKYISNFTEDSFKRVNEIYNLRDDGQKMAYLTFDDGPSRDATVMILDSLKQEGVLATFFVIGNKVEQNPDVLKRIFDEGHYIANHGYSHVYSTIYRNAESVLEEYNKCEEIIKSALQIPEYSSHLFRFPGGSIGGPYNYVKKSAKEILKQNNVATLDWNSLTRDSEGSYPREKLYQNFIETSVGKNNLVILMHDAPRKNTNC